MDEGRRWDQLRSNSLPAVSAVARFCLSGSDAVVLHTNHSVPCRDYLSRQSGYRTGGMVGDPVLVRRDGRCVVCDEMVMGTRAASV